MCAITKKGEFRGKLLPCLLMIFKWLMYFWNQSVLAIPIFSSVLSLLLCMLSIQKFLVIYFVSSWSVFMTSQSCIYVTKMYFFHWTLQVQFYLNPGVIWGGFCVNFLHWSWFTSIPSYPWCPFGFSLCLFKT